MKLRAKTNIENPVIREGDIFVVMGVFKLSTPGSRMTLKNIQTEKQEHVDIDYLPFFEELANGYQIRRSFPTS